MFFTHSFLTLWTRCDGVSDGSQRKEKVPQGQVSVDSLLQGSFGFPNLYSAVTDNKKHSTTHSHSLNSTQIPEEP